MRKVISNRFWTPALTLAIAICVFSVPVTGCRSFLGELTPLFDPGEQTAAINEMFTKINDVRVENDLNKLEWNEGLAEGAQSYSQFIADSGLVYHLGGPWTWCENLYGGNARTNEEVAKMVVDAWLESHGHRANLLDPKISECGIGVAEGGKCIGAVFRAW